MSDAHVSCVDSLIGYLGTRKGGAYQHEYLCRLGLDRRVPLVWHEGATCPTCLLWLGWMLANRPELLVYRKRATANGTPSLSWYELRTGVSEHALKQVNAACANALSNAETAP